MAGGDGNSVRLGSPADQGATEQRRLTLRLLAIADLAPDYDGGPLPVDKESFASVLERLAPEVEVEAPDRLGSGRKSLTCSFVVGSMDQLHPDGVVEAVPILRGLAEARKLLAQCLERKMELDDIRERVVEAFAGTDLSERLRASRDQGAPRGGSTGSSTVGQGETGAIDSLLDQVDVPESVAGEPRASDLVDMLAAVVVPASVPIEREHLESLIREIDLRLTRQVAAIQEQPKLQKLEAAWRGLKFLVDRLDFRAALQLEVLPAGRGDFLERFFEHVFHAEYEGRSEPPLSFVLADFGFGRSVPDLETVRDMARFGQSLNVPFVAAMDPSYWGVRQARLVTKLPDLIQKAQGSEYAKWNRFRAEPLSLWIFLTANRFLLRPGWAEAVRPLRGFTWCAEGDGEKPTWGSPVWAVGAALGQSFAEAGIRFPCAGATSPGVLEDLPVVVRSERTGEPQASPLEVDLEDQRAFQLAQVGFAPLVSQIGSDQVHFSQVPSFHKPARFEDEEATRASFLGATLPYRGFAGAVAHELDRIGREIGGGMAPDDVSERIRQALLGMLAPFEEAEQEQGSVKVEVEDNPDEPGLLDVTARLQPGFQIYGGPVDLVVGTSVLR